MLVVVLFYMLLPAATSILRKVLVKSGGASLGEVASTH